MYDSLDGLKGEGVGDGRQYPAQSEVVEEVECLPADVKDKSSHLSVNFGPGSWSFRVEVAEGNISPEEGNRIL